MSRPLLYLLSPPPSLGQLTDIFLFIIGNWVFYQTILLSVFFIKTPSCKSARAAWISIRLYPGHPKFHFVVEHFSQLLSFLDLKLNFFLCSELETSEANTADNAEQTTRRGRQGLQQLHRVIRPGTVQNSTVQYSTVQYSTVQYSTVQYSTVQYSTVQFSSVQFSSVQYSTVQYSTVQYAEF